MKGREAFERPPGPPLPHWRCDMAAKPLPPQDVLRQLLDYDPETGYLRWRWRPNGTRQWNSRYPGTLAFTKIIERGYRSGQISKSDYLAHRIIWKWWHGYDPDTIDHINGDKLDNRITNLRSVPFRENAKNRPMLRSNRSGETCIFRCGKSDRWIVAVRVNGTPKKLGRFKKIEDAIAARNAGWAANGYHENHGRKVNQ